VRTAISDPENRPWIINRPTTISNSEIIDRDRAQHTLYALHHVAPAPADDTPS
jgi:hypothetical protein